MIVMIQLKRYTGEPITVMVDKIISIEPYFNGSVIHTVDDRDVAVSAAPGEVVSMIASAYNLPEGGAK